MIKAGILIIDKPAGVTSHDVVVAVRKIVNIKKIGHTGTLDPMATGVLILCLGQATRISDLLQGQSKTYQALVKFGIETDSYDADGRIIGTKDCDFDRNRLERIIKDFIGDIDQIPPMTSAISVDGQRLYKMARKNIVVDRPARSVHIDRIDIKDFKDVKKPEAELEIVCSKGTYVRSLCHDIGQALGCGAHLAKLVRSRNGDYGLADAVTIGEVAEAWESGHLADLIIDLDKCLSWLPIVTITPDQRIWVHNGRSLNESQIDQQIFPKGLFRIMSDSRLLAIYEHHDDERQAKAKIVFSNGNGNGN